MLHVSPTENMKTMNDELKLAKDIAAKTQGKLCIFMEVNVSPIVLFAKQGKLMNIN